MHRYAVGHPSVPRTDWVLLRFPQKLTFGIPREGGRGAVRKARSISTTWNGRVIRGFDFRFGQNAMSDDFVRLAGFVRDILAADRM